MKKLVPMTLGALAVAMAGVAVYRAALTPEELRARQAQGAEVDWAAVRPDPAERIRLRILMASGGREGSWIQQRFEERFNIEIEPIFLGAAAYTYAKPLMMAGGDIPDVLLEPDPIMVQRDAYHGFLLEVPYDVILKHAPNYVRVFNEGDAVGWLYANWQGRNYGVPNMFLSLRWSVPGVWRADWLRNVGIERVPETLDEMHEALKRFTFNDPDGNGRQDTWGMSGDVNNWWWASFADIFGAYGVTPFDWQARDGAAVWGGVLPETREALTLLNRWYREGIIHPDFVTDASRASLHRKFYNGVTGYLYYEGKFLSLDPSSPGSLLNKMKALHPDAEVVCGVLPEGPRGLRGGRVWAGGHVIAFGRHMAERPEAVIRVLQILDTLMTDEQLYLDTHLGQRGVHWDFRDPEVGPASGTQRIGDYTDSNVARRALLGSIESCAFFPCCGPPSIVDKYTQREDLAFSRRYRMPERALKDVLGKPDAVPSAGEYLGDLRNYQMTTFAELIRGDKPIEAFDTFVKNWHERGGRVLTEEAQELLEVKKEIYRKVGVFEDNQP